MNTENNKIIAEFMGCLIHAQTKAHLTNDGFYHTKDLKYHSDWNWLMEVINKIEKLDFRVSITEFSTNIGNEKLKISQWQAKTKIENCYNACLEFIKWYNLKNS